MKKTVYYMMYLTGCAINGIVPERDILENIDLESLLKLSKFHCLSATVCTALLSAKLKLSKEWIDCKAKAIRKVILLDAEREKIISFMEKKGIWYMPMKGVIIKEFYPSLGMREMSDNDILFDRRYLEVLKKYMLSNGYSVEGGKNANHYSFQKPPVYNYEMHVELFSRFYARHSRFSNYYDDVKKRLVKDENNNYGYHFTDEDFYIYMMAHGAKHHMDGGTGLRTLADCYLYLKKKPDLDHEYIECELKKMRINGYEHMTRKVAQKIFSKPTAEPNLTEKEKEFLERHLFAGAYGTFENKIRIRKKDMGARNKYEYIFKRIFPDVEFYREYSPIAYKHRILIPFVCIYRMIRVIFKAHRNVMIELKTVLSSKE